MRITRRGLLASTAGLAGAGLMSSRPSRAAITPGKPFAGQEISVLAVQSTQFAAHAKKVAAFTEQTAIRDRNAASKPDDAQFRQQRQRPQQRDHDREEGAHA